MSLFVGNRLVKLDPNGQPMMDPNGPEVHVEWEVVQCSSSFQARGADGEFSHTEQLVLLRKVR